jgi:hypothetical protein
MFLIYIHKFISIIVLLIIAYLLDFSVWGWIIGLVVSYIFDEFILPFCFIHLGEKFLKKWL